MGIIKRYITAKVVTAVASKAFNTMAGTEKARQVVDNISPKLNKLTKTNTNAEALADERFEFHLTIERSRSKDSSHVYDVFDKENNKLYAVKRTVNDYIIHICDANDKEIGTIKEHIPFFGDIRDQKEHIYYLEIKGNPIGNVIYYSNDATIHFNYNHFRVRKSLCWTKYDIYKDDEIVCHINNQFATSDSIGTYVVSFNHKEYEQALLMFIIAMDDISNSGY